MPTEARDTWNRIQQAMSSEGLAAMVWIATLIPGLIEIHRQFQNEPDVI